MAYNDPDWIPESAYAALNLERSVNPDETHEAIARRIFKEHAPIAAARIAQLASHSTNEQVALKAAQYITDRVLGKVGDDQSSVTDPLQQFLDDMARNAENHANKRL